MATKLDSGIRGYAIGDLACFDEINIGREDVASLGIAEEFIDLASQLSKGYDSAQPMIGHEFSVATKFGKMFCLGELQRRRKQFLTECEEAVATPVKSSQLLHQLEIVYKGVGAKSDKVERVTPAQRIQACKTLLTTGKKPRVPKILVIGGNRRYKMRLDAAILWSRVTGKPIGDYIVWVKVLPFISLENSLDHQLQENNQSGRKAYSEVGMFKIAATLCERDATMTEAQVAKRLGIKKRGQAIKVYNFGRLAANLPELNLVERISANVETDGGGNYVYHKDGPVPHTRLDKDHLRALVDRTSLKTVPEEVQAAMGKATSATAAMVEKYLAKRLPGTGERAVKMMSRTALENILKLPNVSGGVKNALTFVLKNDGPGLTDLIKKLPKPHKSRATATATPRKRSVKKTSQGK